LSVRAAQRLLHEAANALAQPFGMDGAALMRERSAILGIAHDGTVSAGGTCQLLPAGDGRWLALNLARASDVELLAAWMRHEWDGPEWDAVAAHLLTVNAADAVDRAQMLGIPAAVAVAPNPDLEATHVTVGALRTFGATPVVIDLSALWAGPLCARLLGARGARVIKAELVGRPDGARAGDPVFWQRLNGGKEERVVDHSALGDLVEAADVVITSARARALEQLGLDLERRVHADGLVWVAITGYGLASKWRERVAFGDDAAVAGGLAVAAGGEDAPVFVGDAPADPLAGLAAASAAADVVESGYGAVVDVSMQGCVAAALTGSKDGSLYARSRLAEQELV